MKSDTRRNIILTFIAHRNVYYMRFKHYECLNERMFFYRNLFIYKSDGTLLSISIYCSPVRLEDKSFINSNN